MPAAVPAHTVSPTLEMAEAALPVLNAAAPPMAQSSQSTWDVLLRAQGDISARMPGPRSNEGWEVLDEETLPGPADAVEPPDAPAPPAPPAAAPPH